MIQHRKTRSRHCAAHEQCQIEYFCSDDNQAICSRCVIMGDHKGHNVQTMEDKVCVCLGVVGVHFACVCVAFVGVCLFVWVYVYV